MRAAARRHEDVPERLYVPPEGRAISTVCRSTSRALPSALLV